MTDALITDDLTRQVHVVKERLTKRELLSTDGDWFPADDETWSATEPWPEARRRVPVEVGDTLELGEPDEHRRLDVTFGDGASTHDYWRVPGCSRSVSVVWEGPAAKVLDGAKLGDWMVVTSTAEPHLEHYARGCASGPDDIPLPAGIGSDPDQWVYLVSNSSGSTSNASDTATK